MAASFARVRFLFGLGVAITGVSACTNDDAAEPPRGPSDLQITRVDTLGTYPSDPSAATEVAASVDCDETLLVSIAPYAPETGKLGDFSLEPPGGCSLTSSETNCGWMVVSVYYSAEVDGIGTFCGKFFGIQSPMQVDVPANCRAGSLRFHLELEDSEAKPVMKDDQNRLAYDYPALLPVSAANCPVSSATSGTASSTDSS